jgi:hypothetical protein
MPQSIRVPGGIIHLAQSKAACPHCKNKFTVEQLEPGLYKSKDGFFRKKCSCGKFVGITTDITGDFVAYPLQDTKP